jgi:hypothetical protein
MIKSGIVNSSTIILNCYKIVNRVSAFDIASSSGHNEVIHRLGYVWCSMLLGCFMRSLILFWLDGVVECFYRSFSACSLPLNPTIQPTSFWVSRACLRTSRTKAAFWLCFIRLEVLLSTLYLLLLVSDFCQSRFEDKYMEATTLARLPFRLGLGRVLDAIVYLQAS